MTVINNVSIWLAKQLDKLKVKNPVAFIAIQSVLLVLFGLFVNDTINLPNPELVVKLLGLIGLETLDQLVIGLLGGIIAIIGPRTTALKNAQPQALPVDNGTV